MADELVDDVVWKKVLTVRVLRGRLDRGEQREDWASIVKSKDDSITLVLGEDEEELMFSSKAIEAIYDLHQEIPR